MLHQEGKFCWSMPLTEIMQKNLIAINREPWTGLLILHKDHTKKEKGGTKKVKTTATSKIKEMASNNKKCSRKR